MDYIKKVMRMQAHHLVNMHAYKFPYSVWKQHWKPREVGEFRSGREHSCQQGLPPRDYEWSSDQNMAGITLKPQIFSSEKQIKF